MNIPEVDLPEMDFGDHPANWDEVLVPLTIKCVPTHKTLKDFLPDDAFRSQQDLEEDQDEIFDEVEVLDEPETE